MRKNSTLFLVELAILTAIELIFCFTILGSVPIVPGMIVATLAHIPAIVAALALGKRGGFVIGLVMGFSSLIVWTYMPPVAPVAFAFTPFAPNGNIWSAVISVVPRALFPVAVAWLYSVLKKTIKLPNAAKLPIAAGIAAAAGTVLHSALVLSAIYLAFHTNPVVGGNYLTFVIAWAGINFLFELLFAVVVSAAVIVPLEKVRARTGAQEV
jgi:uncharacterized membrane protein